MIIAFKDKVFNIKPDKSTWKQAIEYGKEKGISEEQLDLILKKVKDDKILVMEEALTPEEKKELITKSVEEINEKFPGIEFSGLEDSSNFADRFLNTLSKILLGIERRSGITIVGNSDVMEKISEERDSVSLMAKMN